MNVMLFLNPPDSIHIAGISQIAGVPSRSGGAPGHAGVSALLPAVCRQAHSAHHLGIGRTAAQIT